MSPQDNQSRRHLYGIFFYPVLIIGVLIVIAMLAVSYVGHKRTAPPPNGHGPHRISAATLKTLQQKFDADAASMGPAGAPVTVREFGDYQCPACGHFEPVAQKIRQEYVKSGRVRFLFYDFPLPMHAHAKTAAIAARCAARQKSFWPYHDKLYATQDQWASASDATSDFLDIAVEAGLDTGQLKQCIKQKTPLPTLKRERAAGQSIKLRATPTVLVNRTEFIGGPSYSRLKQAIDSALAAAGSSSGA